LHCHTIQKTATRTKIVAHLHIQQMLIEHGDSPDEERIQITMHRARSLSVISATEQLRHLPGVREIRHTP
jgi:hypothetical protein